MYKALNNNELAEKLAIVRKRINSNNVSQYSINVYYRKTVTGLFLDI